MIGVEPSSVSRHRSLLQGSAKKKGISLSRQSQKPAHSQSQRTLLSIHSLSGRSKDNIEKQSRTIRLILRKKESREEPRIWSQEKEPSRVSGDRYPQPWSAWGRSEALGGQVMFGSRRDQSELERVSCELINAKLF